MAKSYTSEHVANIYNVDHFIVEKWLEKKGGTDFEGQCNSEFSKFLGLNPKRLKGPRKRKKKNFQYEKNEKNQTQKKKIEKTSFLPAIQKIESSKYKESAQLTYEKLLLEWKNNAVALQALKKAFHNLKTSAEFKVEKCQKKYFTWHDLSFVENGIKADPNVCFLFIPIIGPTKILKEIEVEYFQKKYKSELYKIYVNKETGVNESLTSPDIEKIKSIVEGHIIRKQKQIISSGKNSLTGTQKYFETLDRTVVKTLNFSDLGQCFPHNKYIQLVGKLLKGGSNTQAIWENNNGNLEESLLITLHGGKYKFVIWENINDNRACYLFKYNRNNFSEKFKKLCSFLTSEERNKREDLFRGYKLRNMDLDYIKYRPVVHETLDLYKMNINSFLMPYFTLKKDE